MPAKHETCYAPTQQKLHETLWNPYDFDLLEFVGKNAAARRARGRFLLFSNPDDILSDALVKSLARRDLDSRVMYATFRGVIDGYVPTERDVSAETMLR